MAQPREVSSGASTRGDERKSFFFKTMRGLGKTEGFGDESALVAKQSQSFVFQHSFLQK